MQKLIPRRVRTAAFLFSCALAGGTVFSEFRVYAQTGQLIPPAIANSLPITLGGVAQAASLSLQRPQYQIDASVDYDLLTLQSSARIEIPATSADPLRDAVFFLYANAGGVGGDDERRKNLVVDRITLENSTTALPFQLTGAVLRVGLPAPQTSPFTLTIDYHGVVPRGGNDSGGLNDLMGGALGGDISSMLGLPSPGGDKEKPKNTDYGLYTYGNGILSLGSFWYPALAVREGGKWADEQPEGLGDVAYAEKSDFTVNLTAPSNVTLVAPGVIARRQGQNTLFHVSAPDAREFAILMSEDYVTKSKPFIVGNKNVMVSATLLRKNAAKLDKSIDIAGTALQIYSRRFGAYPFDEFKLVEAPMKGGAGGMEYSRVVGIASMVFGDLGSQLGGLTTTLDLPGADKPLKSLGDDGDGGGDAKAAPKAGAAAAGGADEGDANPMTDMIGDVLGQQKEIFDSLLETTIAHEVAHQWWAIGVGSDSVRHPFLDESLTNFCAMLYYEDRYGKETAEKQRELNLNASFSMGAQMGGGDKRADLPTSAYTNNLQYGAVIYGKGAIYYDKLRALVGDEAFFGALREYYARWNDRIAGPSTLLQIMEAHAPGKSTQVAALYQHWIEEAHGTEDISSAGGIDINGLLGGILGGDMGGGDGTE